MSLRDPIDTASPQGKFTLQVLGAAAELERALIRERTIAGLGAARAAGRIGGNPGLRRRDRVAIRKVVQARDETYFRQLEATADDWLPLVRRHRPGMPWEDLVRIVNAQRPTGSKAWTAERLRRAARRYVANGLLPASVVERSPRTPGDDRLVAIVAAIRSSDPSITLAGICTRLQLMRERTPRRRSRWQPSSVKMLLDRAGRLGFLPAPRGAQ